MRSPAAAGPARLPALAEHRTEANEEFFAEEAPRIARLCHRMAERFARGGRLVAFGATPAERSDARHVAVEFVHPVIVGKRALPALGLAAEGGEIERQVALAAEPQDIVMGFGEGAESALARARERGCLTVALGSAERRSPQLWSSDALDCGTWAFAPADPDPFVRQELTETLYHLLWEHVHVFLDHPGLLAGRAERATHDSGASSFLYPFLSETETDLDAVLADVEASVAMKAAEIGELRAQTLRDGAGALGAAAAELRARLDAGGALLVLGNGGSATDAMDAAADLRWPPGERGWPARRVLDLTEDAAILTAIANDVGIASVFSRQVIAHGRAGDALVAFSTSGGSENVLAALAEARRRGITSVAFVGYDGGAIAAEGLADHVVVSRSQHIPRIQEAQAGAWHVLRELIEAPA